MAVKRKNALPKHKGSAVQPNQNKPKPPISYVKRTYKISKGKTVGVSPKDKRHAAYKQLDKTIASRKQAKKNSKSTPTTKKSGTRFMS